MLNKPAELQHSRLLDALSYSKEDGLFRWKISTNNRVKVGSVAGTKQSGGYIQIHIDRRVYCAHRLAWFYVHGMWPAEQVDHINGNRTDNRFSNLRECSSSQNIANIRVRKDSRSQVRGVRWDRSRDMWIARITKNGRCKTVGRFDTKAEAGEAYDRAGKELFGDFHKPNGISVSAEGTKS